MKRHYLMKLRRDARLSQTKVAQKVGCNKTTYNLWENGVTVMLTVGNIDDLAQAFGVSPFGIFGLELDWLNGCAGEQEDKNA